jgi:hypothetical protein
MYTNVPLESILGVPNKLNLVGNIPLGFYSPNADSIHITFISSEEIDTHGLQKVIKAKLTFYSFLLRYKEILFYCPFHYYFKNKYVLRAEEYEVNDSLIRAVKDLRTRELSLLPSSLSLLSESQGVLTPEVYEMFRDTDGLILPKTIIKSHLIETYLRFKYSVQDTKVPEWLKMLVQCR